MLVGAAIIAAGWWGRYDLPIIGGLVGWGLLVLFEGDGKPIPELIVVGCLLAYLRKPVLEAQKNKAERK